MSIGHSTACAALEPTAIARRLDEAEQHAAKAFHGIGTGATPSAGDALALTLPQQSLQFSAFVCQAEKALPPIDGARQLSHQPALDQLVDEPAQGLLGKVQNVEQPAHRNLRLAADEMQNLAVTGAEPHRGHRGIRFFAEVAGGEEQEIQPLAQLLLAQEEQ